MKRCPDCGESDVRPDDGRHDALTCSEHLLRQRDEARTEVAQARAAHAQMNGRLREAEREAGLQRKAREDFERDRDTFRDALRALVDALPKCDCGAPATEHGWENGDYSCDIHAGNATPKLAHAEPLRRALALLGGKP